MFQIVFETDNAAFDDTPAIEVVRILREVITRIEDYKDINSVVRDNNGNFIGNYILIHKDA